jgi:DNA (cytosine-5)-methyltransferase 1
MIYGSVCSGIEAATVAWKPLGWEPAWFAEINPFCSRLLKHRYPEVHNHGDFTQLIPRYQEGEGAKLDLLVGGTPCQSFSIAGLRAGLSDPRGGLALSFVQLVAAARPRWVCWENVPGSLSADGGRAFASLVGGLQELGYGVAWRVLDAQYVRVDGFPRAVPQRRRRVFLVGHSSGDIRRPAAVLLEPEGVRGDHPPRRRTREEVAGASGRGLEAGVPDVCGTLSDGAHHGGGLNGQDAFSGRIIPVQPVPYDLLQVTHPLNAQSRSPGDPCHCLAKENASSAAIVETYPIQDCREINKKQNGLGIDNAGDPAYTIDTTGAQGVSHKMRVRRLTPLECERLMGFAPSEVRVSMSACFDPASSAVRVDLKCRKSRSSAWAADAEGSKPNASSAPPSSSTNLARSEGVAEVSVLLQSDAWEVKTSKAGRSQFVAKSAGRNGSSLPPTPAESSAQHLARLLRTPEIAALLGREASHQFTMPSTTVGSGSSDVERSGQGTAASVAGASSGRTKAKDKSTTSNPGHSTPTSDSQWTTLFCSVLNVIGGCTLPQTLNESIEVELAVRTPYTDIPKKSKRPVDGHRYKALGNSIAVNCMRWIGERIAKVDAIPMEAP